MCHSVSSRPIWEDFLISTRPMGGDKVDDYILFSVPIRDLFVSSKKQDLVDSTQTVGDNQSEIKTSQVKKMKKIVLMVFSVSICVRPSLLGPPLV